MVTTRPRAYHQQVTDDDRWSAVLERNGSYDGQFVYAVASTGIYCRPSCPSRRPGRGHVQFFTRPSDAETAGYRACRRCEPTTAGPDAATRRVLEARAYLDAHPDETITLEQLGQVVGLSPYHLQRSFKRLMGLSPMAYARAQRLERLKGRLRKGDTVSRATYEAGYGSASRAYDETLRLGMTPATYRRGGRGARIRYTIVDAPLGQLLVASTDRGICFVSLGDDATPLEAELHDEFPEASITRQDADPQLARWARDITALAGGGDIGADLPLDVPGTPFQWRVWEYLRKIPPGERRSYSAVATALGTPTGARAVARACATNPVALVIPCHRVLRGDGELGGYRWGLERKRQLLEREQR